MKTSELIKKLNDAGFISYMNDYDMIVISTKNMKFNICIVKDFTELDDVKLNLSEVKLTLRELAKLSQLLLTYAETPLDEREDKPKYRVPLRGFKSDNGSQYLTCENNIHGHVFACAPNHSLKQEFTCSELDQLCNDLRFKAIPWFKELIRSNVEEVKDD